MLGVVIGTAAAAGAWIAAKLARYGATSRGANPWTLRAVINVLGIARHIEAARAAISGRLSSVFRSPDVNESLPGASKTSRHMDGLAADIVPGAPFTVESASRKIAALARQGLLGPVRCIIWEPGWVHVDWFAAGEARAPLKTRRNTGTAAAPTYVEVTL